MELVTVMTALVALAGLTMIVVGWRGRRIDDHPLCRRCGFDLTGRAPDTTRCAECGADVTAPRAIRFGHRQRRGLALFGGVVVTLPAMLLLGLAAFVSVRELDPTPYKPAWLLAREVTSGTPAAGRSLFELTRRLEAGTLSDAHLTAVAAACLASQGQANLPWDPAWGHFIEAARAAGRLPDDAWARYARQAFVVTMHLTPLLTQDSMPNAARRGNPIELLTASLSVDEPRVAAASFTAIFRWEELLVDDQPAGKMIKGPLPRVYYARIDVSGTRTDTMQAAPTIDMTRGTKPLPGLHIFRATIGMQVYESSGLRGRRAPLPPLPSTEPLAETDLDVGASLSLPEPGKVYRYEADPLSL